MIGITRWGGSLNIHCHGKIHPRDTQQHDRIKVIENRNPLTPARGPSRGLPEIPKMPKDRSKSWGHVQIMLIKPS